VDDDGIMANGCQNKKPADHRGVDRIWEVDKSTLEIYRKIVEIYYRNL
jgi:hypothetical protein